MTIDDVNGHDPVEEAAAPLLQWQIATSPDLKRVQITIPYQGEQVFQTNISIEDFEQIAAIAQRIVDVARTRGMLPEVPANQPRIAKGWAVGRPNAITPQKTIAILFDIKLPTNQIWFFADLDALKVADAIEQEVFKGMSEDDKRKLLIESNKKPALILPPGTPIKGRH